MAWIYKKISDWASQYPTSPLINSATNFDGQFRPSWNPWQTLLLCIRTARSQFAWCYPALLVQRLKDATLASKKNYNRCFTRFVVFTRFLQHHPHRFETRKYYGKDDSGRVKIICWESETIQSEANLDEIFEKFINIEE